MSNETSARLKQNIEKIMVEWEKRTIAEIAHARDQSALSLRDSIPEYIFQLSDALSLTIDRTRTRAISDQNAGLRVGKKHGRGRAEIPHYTMDQLVSEYHILRQVICATLEESQPLTHTEREIIICSIEQAVNDAATEFSDALQEFQERLSHNLAHDFRGPITAVKVSSQIILRHPDVSENSRKAAQRISGSMERLDSMIRDLLDAGKLKCESKVSSDEPTFDLKVVTEQVIEGFNFNYPNRFVLKTSGDCMGHWDEKDVVRIFENLITNALKYGAPRAPVTITLLSLPDHTKIMVHNEGSPIPAEDQCHLFDRYHRLDSTKERPGWGLGLSLIKGLVDAYRGSITIRSELREGTTFTIELPNRSAVGGRQAKIELKSSLENQSRETFDRSQNKISLDR